MEYLESSGQAEQLREIGAKLSQERQARSLSLEEIAAKTYIPVRLLNAIDAGRLEVLPEPVFIQGFIRRYADALGMDGTALSKGFSIEPPQPTPKINLMETPQHPPTEEVASLSEPSLGEPLPWRYILGGVVGLGVVGLIAASLANRPKVAKPPASTQNSVSSAVSSPAPKASPKAIASPKAAVSPSPTQVAAPSPGAKPVATDPVQVKLNLTDESWLEIRVDGKVAYEGTLPKGTQRSWSGKQQVVILTGNAGAVSVSYNNSAAKTLGALGAVASASFPPT